MILIRSILLLVFLLNLSSTSSAQVGESPIRFFGFFQTQIAHQDGRNDVSRNSFNLQQMNIFAQKDLAKNWTSLINLEFLNNFSSEKLWGAFNLEEAWVKYRGGKGLNLKVGLQIPIFNNLNEINNRTPLLPYIIRPLAYETSFFEFINIEDFIPKRTFIQAYGYIPSGDLKFDYAVYFGNSPNIGTIGDNLIGSQSGLDSTNTFLLGGRMGVRFKELKAGFSYTYDEVDDYNGIDTLIGLLPSKYDLIRRMRFGGDLSYRFQDFSFEAEYIKVFFDDDSPDFDVDKMFYYGTLGYQISDRLLVYYSHMRTEENLLIRPLNSGISVKVTVKGFGSAYDFNERIRLKIQYGAVNINVQNLPEQGEKFDYYSAAISVFF